jgi:cysteinyl-tRNA synthetase
MSEKILGLPLDIHGGGQDLIFPHHEDEIAQSEAAYEKQFSNYWVHNGMVNVEKVKMSKSLGNFKTIRDLLKDYSGEVIRYFVISTQYRKPIDFSKKALDDAKIAYERLKNIVVEFKDDKEVNTKYIKEFRDAMDDDLNTPEALAVLWKVARDKEAKGKVETIKEIDKVFGLNLEEESIEVPAEVKKLVKEREEMRKKKNWEEADNIRRRIEKIGYSIADSEEGTKIKKN